MKSWIPAVLITAVVVGCSSTRETAPSSVRSEVELLNDSMMLAVNRGDMRGAASFYADNAVVRNRRGVVVSGRQQIDKYFEDIGRAQWKLDVLDVGGQRDTPYQVGRSTLIHGTKPDTSIVHFVVYWQRQSHGRLRILLDYYH